MQVKRPDFHGVLTLLFKRKDRNSGSESAILPKQAINGMTQLQFQVGFWRVQKGFLHNFDFNYN